MGTGRTVIKNRHEQLPDDLSPYWASPGKTVKNSKITAQMQAWPVRPWMGIRFYDKPLRSRDKYNYNLTD